MQFIKETNINFVGIKKVAFAVSFALIAISIISLIVHKGPRYGVDFSGGSAVQIKFEGPVTINAVKKGLKPAGLAGASVQRFGNKSDNEFQIRSKKTFASDSNFGSKVKSAMLDATGVTVRDLSLDMVGPQVSKDLRQKALLAMFYALLFIIIYISGRFELKWGLSGILAAILGGAVYGVTQLQNIAIVSSGMPILIITALVISIFFCWKLELKYAMGAIVALLHDVTLTVGIFSILGIEFTLPIVAALLTIIGYSLNDTIIVFDRIRENSKKYAKKDLDFIINRSVNETLSRTILTSITTLVVVVALYVLGGGVIHDFAFAMIIGVLTGTYSSIYVASPILLAWQTEEA
ncbi:MAG: protein translocase subunit SecF [Desulfobacterales bacterium]|nr:protein translocase subunit SecF [Desulfobacterales bacterium]